MGPMRRGPTVLRTLFIYKLLTDPLHLAVHEGPLVDEIGTETENNLSSFVIAFNEGSCDGR